MSTPTAAELDAMPVGAKVTTRSQQNPQTYTKTEDGLWYPGTGCSVFVSIAVARTLESEDEDEDEDEDEHPTPEEFPMSNKASPLLASIIEGSKDGAASALAEEMSRAFLRSSTGQRLPAVVHTPVGVAVLSYLMPVAVWAAATWMPDTIPSADKVASVALRAVRGHTVRHVVGVIAEMRGFFLEMAEMDKGGPPA